MLQIYQAVIQNATTTNPLLSPLFRSFEEDADAGSGRELGGMGGGEDRCISPNLCGEEEEEEEEEEGRARC